MSRYNLSRNRIEWILFGLFNLALGALLGYWTFDQHSAIEALEGERLEVQARVISENLGRQLEGVANALGGVRDDLPQWNGRNLNVAPSRRLKVLTNAMPGVRTLLIMSADGTILDSSRVEIIGQNFSEREYFKVPRGHPDPAMLFVSSPFKTTLGIIAINVTRVIAGPGGEFAGIVAATLDPEYFSVLLRSVLYAPDMRAVVAHWDGKAFLFMPEREGVAGSNLDRPGSFSRRHRESGRVATLFTGTSANSGDERMMATRTVERAGLALDKPLVIHVSRNLSAMLASWRAQSIAYGMFYALFAAAAAIGLYLVQRRRREMSRLAAAREQERRGSSERLELALAGGDLGLWDWHVPSGRMMLNDRWSMILGYRREEIEPHISAWEKLVHPADMSSVSAELDCHFKGEKPAYETEHRLRHKDGRWIWILDRGKVMERDAAGAPVRMVGTYLDITERKRAEEERKQYFRFFELSLDAMCIADPFGCFKQVNPAFLKLTGYTEDELLAKPFLEFVLPEDRQRTADEMKLQVAVRPSIHFENRYVCKEGRTVFLTWMAYFDKSDGVTYAIARDLTEQKQKEAEYRTVIQASPDGFGITDFSGRILEVNAAICRMLGYSREELLRLGVADIVAEEAPEEIAARIRAMIPAGSALIQGRHRRKDGEIIDVEVNALCVAALGERLFVFIRDVGERKRAEKKITELNRDFVSFLENTSDFVYYKDAHSRFRFCSQTLAEITGHASWRDMIGKHDREVFPKDTAQIYIEEEGPVFLEGKALRNKIDPYYDASGNPGWVSTSKWPVLDHERRVVGLFGISRDITERIAAEEELRKSVALRELLSEAMPLPVFYKDAEGRYTGCNSAFERFIGKFKTEVIGKTVFEVSQQSFAKTYRDKDLDLLSGPVSTQTYESAVAHADGTVHDVIFHKARITDDAGVPTGIVGVITDITELKQIEARRDHLEAQLRESQKMEALGTLAGGVAHDFNNIVAAIMGNVELARQDVGPGHAALESLEEIRKASRRAKDLVQQILAFGRRQQASREVVSLAPVVEESARLLRTTLPAGVDLKVELDPDAPAVLADATQVEQVLLNLCANAWHAIQNQGRPGTIEIRLQAHERAEDRAPDADGALALGGLRPGRYACISVQDNGTGMDKETLARMFEPFFTTKPVGKGTGLGLSVVHGIVQDHGASIEVDSVRGEGSTFRVYFPEVRTSARAADTPIAEALPAHGQGKRVLYVDDDESIVFLMTRLLERQGYRVSGYTDARTALAAVRADPVQFDLAVTDYNMPGMSGLDLARSLRELRADLPIAVASGYITDELREQAPAAGVSELVYKPNTVEELCAAVARLARSLPV